MKKKHFVTREGLKKSEYSCTGLGSDSQLPLNFYKYKGRIYVPMYYCQQVASSSYYDLVLTSFVELKTGCVSKKYSFNEIKENATPIRYPPSIVGMRMLYEDGRNDLIRKYVGDFVLPMFRQLNAMNQNKSFILMYIKYLLLENLKKRVDLSEGSKILVNKYGELNMYEVDKVLDDSYIRIKNASYGESSLLYPSHIECNVTDEDFKKYETERYKILKRFNTRFLKDLKAKG